MRKGTTVATAPHRTGLAKWIPLLEWLPRYQRSWLRNDVVAGVTVWALVVPQAIAYAQIAGLPPQAGVFSAFAAPLGYALFGTSRQLIVSPTSATAAISAALVAPLVVAGDAGEYAALSAGLAILCGLVFLLLGRFNMGFLSQFIAPAVQTGFLIGLGLTIMTEQFCKVLGIDPVDGPFYKQAWHILTTLDETSGWTLLIGGGSLALLIVLGRITRGLPLALIIVILAIAVVSIFNLDGKGVDVVGAVDRAIPLPKIPRVDLVDLLTLSPGTLAIVVIGYSESMSVSRGFADRHHYRIDANQELTALGMSSIFGGIFQSFITGGGASQSAANDRAGAKTQGAGIVLAVLAFLSALILMPLFKNLPQAVLGAIVINAVMGFVNIPAKKRLHRLRSDSFWLAVTALIGVLVLGILPGLLITAGISVLLLLGHFSRPSGSSMERLPNGEAFAPPGAVPGTTTVPGLLVYRPDLPLSFVNTTWVLDLVREEISRQLVPPSVVVLDLDATPELDVSGVDFLVSLHRELANDNQELWISRANPRVLAIVTEGELRDAFGDGKVWPTNRDAWQAFRQRSRPVRS